MFCKNCGAPLNDNQAVCLNCGVNVGTGNSYCPNCGDSVNPEAVFCVKCGVSLEKKGGNGAANVAGIPMRSVATCIILSLITCGIYSIYWFVCLTNAMNQASGKTNDTSGGMAFLLTLITCGIYGYYWAYKIGEKRDIISNENASSGLIYILLTFFGLGIVVYALAQDALNKAIARK